VTSNVDIVNSALNMIGASNISSLDENTKAAKIMNQRFEGVRDSVFRSHPWNCLIRRATLAQEVDVPEYGYLYQYALPTDPYCLRILEFSNGSMTYPYDNMTNNRGGPAFVVEGRKLVTDEGTAKIKYVARVTDPNELDVSLADTLSSRLAMETCYAITGSTSMIQLMSQIYEAKLKESRFVDATENAPQRIEASDLIESRY
jgi:hypothetical protein